jgi:hypothetical protein
MVIMENEIKNEDAGVIKAYEHLKSVLVTGETIEAWAVQRRLFALTHRRIFVAATSGRFIAIKRGLIGGFNMTELRWQDLGDIQLKVGIFGADIFLKKFASTDLAMNKYSTSILSFEGMRKSETQKIYRLAQAQDQSWREKRRIRELEELRAKSGGLNLGNSHTGMNQTGNASEDSLTRLQKAKEMLDNKLITDADFESIKAKIISGL